MFSWELQRLVRLVTLLWRSPDRCNCMEQCLPWFSTQGTLPNYSAAVPQAGTFLSRSLFR
ncbi:hypothetical protein NG797_01735 [Laspinema sp. D5]|nr:hypothetical protein [Laspinema sp. D3d]